MRSIDLDDLDSLTEAVQQLERALPKQQQHLNKGKDNANAEINSPAKFIAK